MKRILLKATTAFVYMILGFLLVNRINYYVKHQTVNIKSTDHNQLDILTEIEQLKQQKELLKKENNDILSGIKSYEEAVSSDSIYLNDLKLQLEQNRLLLGMTDTKGPGIIIYLTPKSGIFNELSYLGDMDIAYIVNELFSATAEAVCINNIRITSQSVMESSNNLQIRVNSKLFPINEQITIKAIGNADVMKKNLENYGTLTKREGLKNYSIDIKKSEDITIPGYDLKFNVDGLRDNEKNK